MVAKSLEWGACGLRIGVSVERGGMSRGSRYFSTLFQPDVSQCGLGLGFDLYDANAQCYRLRLD